MLTEVDMKEILSEVTCDFMGKDFEFRLQPKDTGWNLQCRIQRPDTESGEWGEGAGGKYYVSPHSSVDEIVKKCLAACMAYAEHEIREGFTWRERRIFGPHIGLEALWEAAPHVTYKQDQR